MVQKWGVYGCFMLPKLNYQWIRDRAADTIWKIKIPSKIQAFLWLVARQTLLTWDNLQRREWTWPDIYSLCLLEEEIYSLCLLEEENIRYLFLGCIYMHLMWSQLKTGEVERGQKYRHTKDIREVWKEAQKITWEYI